MSCAWLCSLPLPLSALALADPARVLISATAATRELVRRVGPRWRVASETFPAYQLLHCTLMERKALGGGGATAARYGSTGVCARPAIRYDAIPAGRLPCERITLEMQSITVVTHRWRSTDARHHGCTVTWKLQRRIGHRPRLDRAGHAPDRAWTPPKLIIELMAVGLGHLS